MATQTFTFAPTEALTIQPAKSLTREIDRIQNAFNMSLQNTADRPALMPISDALYDLFCAYEQGSDTAYEMHEALIATVKAHPCHDTAAMMDAANELEEALFGEMEF